MATIAGRVDMKIDGRTLTREAQEAMRFIALDRMGRGGSPAAVSASIGMHRGWPTRFG